MTSAFLRPAIALTIALALAGCGGKASFPINGTVDGQAYSPLVLTTNGMDTTVNLPANTSTANTFTFPNSLSYGDEYDVQVKTQPPHQTCVVSGGTDTAGRIASINVLVSCALNASTIGGSDVNGNNITGLTSEGLVLNNSTDTLVVPLGSTTFTFGIPVPFGASYGVTVLAQPASDICTVGNGTGIMGDTAVTNIQISCVPKPPPPAP